MSNSFLNVSVERFKNKERTNGKKRGIMNRIIEILGILLLVIGIIGFLTFWKVDAGSNIEFEKLYQECIDGEKIAIYARAISTGKVSLCEKSYDPELCKARIQKISTICESYGIEKEYCEGTILQDIGKCGNSVLCKAEVLQDPKLCEDLESVELIDYGEKTCRILAGEKISYEDKCVEKTWQRIARLYYTPEFCDNILNETRKKECVSSSAP